MHVYVSADLKWFTAPAETMLAPDISQIDEDNKWRAYRRLDNLWYAWLCDRMRKLKTLHECKQISDSQWDTMRTRHATIWGWACALWGNQVAADSATIIPSAKYCAPMIRANNPRYL